MKHTSHGTGVPAVVHIVDDEAEVRCLLEKVVRRAAYQTITYASASEFLQSYEPHDRECLILDLRMPGQTGLDLLRTLAGRSHDVPVLCLSGSVSIAEAVALIKLGAVDVLEKPWDQSLLLHRISAAIQICGEVRHSRGQWRRRLDRLTERERQVMVLLVRGEKTESIARQLNISPSTVEKHRIRIMDKMEVDSVIALVHSAHLAQPSTRSLLDDARLPPAPHFPAAHPVGGSEAPPVR